MLVGFGGGLGFFVWLLFLMANKCSLL